MNTVCQHNKEKKGNTHLCVKEARRNIASLLSYLRNAVFFRFSLLPFLLHLNPSVGFGTPRLNLAFSPRAKVAGFRRRAEGGGLGSPLTGFSPNTGISFLMISPKLLDICPVFLLLFSPNKTGDLLILF